MPMTCAPSMAERIPFERASALSSFAGSTTPVTVVMWLKKIDAGAGSDGVIEKIEDLGGVFYREGQGDFLHTTP